MNSKEFKDFKEYWSNKTVGELRGYIEDKEQVLNNMKRIVKESAQKIIELDVENINYPTRLLDLSNTIKSFSKDISELIKCLEAIKPVFEKKEQEGINKAEYEKYLTDNKDNIDILVKAVEELKERNREEFKTKFEMEDEEIDSSHEFMLKELIWMLKDSVGNISKVNSLSYNGHKGFDGFIEGEKGSVSINTIGAGGYNIQRYHFRTLINRF